MNKARRVPALRKMTSSTGARCVTGNHTHTHTYIYCDVFNTHVFLGSIGSAGLKTEYKYRTTEE